MLKANSLRLLFSALREADYEWQPQTPDRLLVFRKDPSPFRPLSQWLGLGLAVTRDDLINDGFSPNVFQLLIDEGFAKLSNAPASVNESYKSEMAISGSGDLMIVHDHWPPSPALTGNYVHYAAESAWLARACTDDLEGFIDKRVLDLGCSSGALAFEVAVVASEVLGLDISERAIEWARLGAAAHGLRSMRFECARIGDARADSIAGAKHWDCAIMNPPMIVPARDASYPHRDGGKWGIELPLLFLEFAARHLREGGEVLTLITNPILNGKPAFFDRFNTNQAWEVIQKRCLHRQFNQSVARKQGYGEQGIENVELWFLHLKKL